MEWFAFGDFLNFLLLLCLLLVWIVSCQSIMRPMGESIIIIQRWASINELIVGKNLMYKMTKGSRFYCSWNILRSTETREFFINFSLHLFLQCWKIAVCENRSISSSVEVFILFSPLSLSPAAKWMMWKETGGVRCDDSIRQLSSSKTGDVGREANKSNK